MRKVETIVFYLENGVQTAVTYYSDGKKVRYTKKFPNAVASFIARNMDDKKYAALKRRGWVSL